MEASKKCHICVNSQGTNLRFKVNDLILLYSNGRLQHYYVYRSGSTAKVELISVAKKLKNLEDYFDHTFYDLREGWHFNLNFYKSHTGYSVKTTIEEKAELLPDLIVSRARLKGFNDALKK
ncbi:MAG: hypothetical protein K9G41_12775 [Flavobacteriales bacterium]|jgi:hypothetical protein|nr:hypothetical protein [Flavobacteriales bacterium]